MTPLRSALFLLAALAVLGLLVAACWLATPFYLLTDPDGDQP